MEMEKKADEIYASGFLSRFASGQAMAVVSAASKLEQTSGRESAATPRNLKAGVRALGLGYAELKSSWTRTGGKTGSRKSQTSGRQRSTA